MEIKGSVPHSNTKYLRTFLGRCANKLFKVTTFVWDSIGLNPDNYFFGSQWFSVTRNFVEQVIDEDNEDFFKTFHNITCADEHAFAIFARTNILTRMIFKITIKDLLNFQVSQVQNI